jgi:succinoglycan biosynthesis protein ExoM
VASAQAPTIAICIASCRRPVGLGALLDSVGALVLPPDRMGAVFAIVVDNDHGGSARPVVEAFRERSAFPVTYLVEPDRNIALARNRGVAEALRRNADFVAFIDDDEVADPLWLDRLVDGQRRFGADAVVGRVEPVFPPDTPAYIVRGEFFQQPRYPTGTPLKLAQTNNVLVAASLLRAQDGPFDPAFGVSGGSDSLFFSGRERAGARYVFVDDAIVRERIPLTRTRTGWVLRRSFRVGNVAVHVERTLPPSSRRVGERVAKAMLRMGYGAVTLLPLGLLRGRAGLVQGLWNVAYGAGCLAALAGYRGMEYRTIHGE